MVFFSRTITDANDWRVIIGKGAIWPSRSPSDPYGRSTRARFVCLTSEMVLTRAEMIYGGSGDYMGATCSGLSVVDSFNHFGIRGRIIEYETWGAPQVANGERSLSISCSLSGFSFAGG